jgi:hypothetical protein
MCKNLFEEIIRNYENAGKKKNEDLARKIKFRITP